MATWQDDPGHGEVVTFCVYYSEIAGPAWRTALPYTVAVIHLWYSGIKILSNLVCDDLTLVRIGLPVQVMFDRMSERITTPKFIPYVAKDTSLSA